MLPVRRLKLPGVVAMVTDRERNLWATQILPFGDPASFVGYMNLETAVYAHLKAAAFA